MPFKQNINDQIAPEFNSSDAGLAMLKEILQQNINQQNMEYHRLLNPITPQDYGIPAADEDLNDFEVDPNTMPWSKEATERNQIAFWGESASTIQNRAMQTARQEAVMQNVITKEEQEGIDFLDKIASAEKSKSYNTISKSGTMVGRYQFNWNEWGDDIVRETGAKSKQEFLRNPEMQDKFFTDWYKPNVLDKESEPLYEGFKRFYPDASKEDLQIAMHLAGGPNIRKGIEQGNLTNWRDGNGFSIAQYMERSKNAHSRNVIPNDGVDYDVDNELKTNLDILQDEFGINFYVNSGHRDEHRNAKAGGAKNSAHMRKKAIDLDLVKMGKSNDIDFKRRLIKRASELGVLGIGVYKNNVHLDRDNSLGRRAWGPDYKSTSVPAWAQDVVNEHLNRK